VRLSLHIWKFEILLWLRRRKPVPSVVVAEPDSAQTVMEVLNGF